MSLRSRKKRSAVRTRQKRNGCSRLHPLLLSPTAEFDGEHYARVLRDSYAERLRVVFEAEDFSQLFRLDGQQGLFDRPIEQMQLRWIRYLAPKAKE